MIAHIWHSLNYHSVPSNSEAASDFAFMKFVTHQPIMDASEIGRDTNTHILTRVVTKLQLCTENCTSLHDLSITNFDTSVLLSCSLAFIFTHSTSSLRRISALNIYNMRKS